MKKLMIALAVVAIAATSQAVTFKWGGTNNGVALTGLDGNDTYAAAGAAMKGNSTLTAVLTIFSADGQTTIGSATKTVAYNFSDTGLSTSFSVNGTAVNTDYLWTLTVTGTQTDMRAYTGDPNWDYSAATVSTTLSGSITTASQGATTFTASPASWTVAGAVAKTQPIPEPTSGLLLLLGTAGLALRRRRA